MHTTLIIYVFYNYEQEILPVSSNPSHAVRRGLASKAPTFQACEAELSTLREV